MTCQRKTKTKIFGMKMSNLILTLLIANILLVPYFLFFFLFFNYYLFSLIFFTLQILGPSRSTLWLFHIPYLLPAPPAFPRMSPRLTYQHKSLYLSVVNRKENLILGRFRVRIDLQNHACLVSWNLVICKCLLVQMPFVQFPL